MRPRDLSIDAASTFARSATAALVFACALAVALPRAAHAAADDSPSSGPPATPSEAPAPTAIVPMTPAAQALYDRGLELFRTRDFPGAVRVLEQGFAIEPRREFLFAQAQALRLAGDCARAIPLYQRFIDLGAPPVQAQAARLGLDRCAPERASATGPALAPSAVPTSSPRSRVPAAPGGEAGPAAPPAEPSVWWRDPWVIASAGLGVAALAIGTSAFVASERWKDQAQSPQTSSEPEFDKLWELASGRRELALTSLAVGVGLLAAGGARALWLHNRQAAPGRSPAPAQGFVSPFVSPFVSRFVPAFVPARTGGTLSWEGQF